MAVKRMKMAKRSFAGINNTGIKKAITNNNPQAIKAAKNLLLKYKSLIKRTISELQVFEQ
ncbi:hypothetical protein D3C87_1609760 [compost metagenome]